VRGAIHAFYPGLNPVLPPLAQIVRDQNITGLAAGIVKDGRLLYARGWGAMKFGDLVAKVPGVSFEDYVNEHMACRQARC
jgi:CubicO group peptidase (beta-lactamase class C family)